MYTILYNPLSRNGNSKKVLKKLYKKLNKKNVKYETLDITLIKDVGRFLSEHKTSTSFVIVGGDGTLNVLANNIKDYQIKQNIYLYKSGTGNDFLRSLPKRKGLVDIKKYLYNLPKITFNNNERLFLNGTGLGLDGLVVSKVNNSKYKKNKFNYFRHTLEAFREFKAKKATIIVDGKEKSYDKVWLISAMNDKYFGGGMKIAPKANRLKDDLNLVIVKKANKFMLFLLFPFIYLGIHTIFKRYVEVIKGNNIKITFTENTILQIDGEEFNNIKEVKISK